MNAGTHLIARLQDISYIYPKGETPALTNVSLEVRRGEFLGIIGPTGAGKTTLCLAFNGIVPQFYGGRFFGQVTVAGLDTVETPISRLAHHVGMVFEDPEIQLTATSVENEIAFALENLGVPREEIRRRIPRVLEAVGLPGTERRHPHLLSGGEKQRLAIASALALRPDLLVLDEPTSQLDPAGVQEIFTLLGDLNRESGVTVIVASHAVEELAEHAQTLVLLARGSVEALGTPEEVYSRVDLLETHQIRPPQVTEVFHRLRERGAPMTRLPVRLDEGLAMMAALQDRCEIRTPVEPGSDTVTRGGENPLIAVQNLRHVYDDGTVALRDISLNVHAGEFLLIVGQNGAGKTTLVKHFLKLLEPTDGSIKVWGQETTAYTVSELARRIGYVGQNPDHQLFTDSVEAEIAFAPRMLGYSPAEIQRRATESMRAVGIFHRRDAHPLTLPRGERARVVVAAALAMEPEVVIFDEPTTGQDLSGARAILDLGRTLHEQGRTVIVITHHLHLMPDYAERVVVLGEGQVILDAPLREAYHQFHLLRTSYLIPPQSVILSRSLRPPLSLLTPEELAEAFHCDGVEVTS